MSTVLRSSIGEDPATGPASRSILADRVRVYPVLVGTDGIVAVDLQQRRGVSALGEPIIHRLGVTVLTRDEATNLIRAIMREAKISDLDVALNRADVHPGDETRRAEND